jgi:hypothetical protein
MYLPLVKLLVQYKPTVHDWDRAFWRGYCQPCSRTMRFRQGYFPLDRAKPILLVAYWHEAAEPGCPLQRSRSGVNRTRRGQPSSVENDPGLCENAKAINRDRTSYSFKIVSCAHIASAFNFEIEIKDIILVALRTFEFSHGLDP